MGGKDEALALRRAVDAVPADQLEDQFGSVGGGGDQPLAKGVAELLPDVILVVLEVGHHLAEVAARGAPADLLGLEHDGADAALAEMEGGREAGEAGAYDRHRGAVIAFERQRHGSRWREGIVEAGDRRGVRSR